MEACYPEQYATMFSGDDTTAPPGGESERDVDERVAAGVDRVRERRGSDAVTYC